MENNTPKRNLSTDKVEISVLALIEIKRAFRVLLNDRTSYVHRVYSDDYVYDALKELSEVYNNYFNEKIEKLN